MNRSYYSRPMAHQNWNSFPVCLTDCLFNSTGEMKMILSVFARATEYGLLSNCRHKARWNSASLASWIVCKLLKNVTLRAIIIIFSVQSPFWALLRRLYIRFFIFLSWMFSYGFSGALLRQQIHFKLLTCVFFWSWVYFVV